MIESHLDIHNPIEIKALIQHLSEQSQDSASSTQIFSYDNGNGPQMLITYYLEQDPCLTIKTAHNTYEFNRKGELIPSK